MAELEEKNSRFVHFIVSDARRAARVLSEKFHCTAFKLSEKDSHQLFLYDTSVPAAEVNQAFFETGLAVLILGGVGYRLFWLHARYPSPHVQTYGLHESIEAGGYDITFSDWQWENGSPRERTGIAELTVTKTTANETALDLTNISFESGAWGSQFDAQLMFELNSNLESLLLQMNEGESEAIRFPITMIDQQFTAEQWERIDERGFCIVLQYYPEKLQFKCPVSSSAQRD